MKKYNAYERIQFYYTLLINDKNTIQLDDSFPLGITINRLHEISDLPLKIIRKDFLQMFTWQGKLNTYPYPIDSGVTNCATILTFDDSDKIFDEINNKYHLGDLYNELMDGTVPNDFASLLLDGVLDNIPIYIASKQDGIYHIPLTIEEAEALRQLSLSSFKDTNDLDRTYSYSFDTKNSFMFSHYYIDLNKRLDCINLAIKEKCALSIRYKTSKGEIIFADFNPLKITYDADEDLYCVLTIQNNQIQVYRLDHIISLNISTKIIDESPDESLLEIAPNVWGNCFSDTPEKVKVKFYNEANVWQKVKKDLAYRTNGKLYEKDGYLYYEDIVYGLNKFRSWIYGYGSSAIVLAPKKLQDEIICSLKERL